MRIPGTSTFEQNGWHTNIWRGWAANNSLTDLHPVFPENFERVVIQPLFQLSPALRTLHLDAKKGRDVAARHGSNEENDAESSRKLHPAGAAGCEEKLVAQWTNWQRMMCLVPDVDTVTAA